MRSNAVWLGIIALAIAGLGLWMFMSRPKYGYVFNTRLFNDFSYKKELEKQLKQLEHHKTLTLDSLKLALDVKAGMLEEKSSKTAIEEFKIYEQQYLLKQKQASEDYDRVAKEYTEQVWKQLNQYVKEYGEKNSYAMIFGTTANGEIMYANESEELTDEILSYANSRYQGAEK